MESRDEVRLDPLAFEDTAALVHSRLWRPGSLKFDEARRHVFSPLDAKASRQSQPIENSAMTSPLTVLEGDAREVRRKRSQAS